jgi:ubiquinone/menaquinone biosynthesis C-methylase UbiE
MNVDILRRALPIVAGAVAAVLLARQCRRPSGPFGRLLARSMNVGHAKLTAWGLGHIEVASDARVLDIGCGGGATMQALAVMASAGRVDGVDYATASVATARENNAELIHAGRGSVQQASVAKLPFADASFDVVTAVETHYYWPDLPNSLREVHRVVAPGGRFLLVAETYKGRSFDWVFRPVMRVLFQATYLSPDEHRAALKHAGFEDVVVDTLKAHGWICAVGTRRA